MLPKEYDRHYDKDGAYEHMRGATTAEKGVCTPAGPWQCMVVGLGSAWWWMLLLFYVVVVVMVVVLLGVIDC